MPRGRRRKRRGSAAAETQGEGHVSALDLVLASMGLEAAAAPGGEGEAGAGDDDGAAGRADMADADAGVRDGCKGVYEQDHMALTMHQPWGSLLVWGLKRIEGRSWQTSYRGRLWIHAKITRQLDHVQPALHQLPVTRRLQLGHLEDRLLRP